MKKFYQILLLFIILVSSTFADDDVIDFDGGCKKGGTCMPGPHFRNFTAREFYIDKDGPCYYYQCRINNQLYMRGVGKYDDFINTCKYIEPWITQKINQSIPKNGKTYAYNDHNLILAVCEVNKQEECEKEFVDNELTSQAIFEYKNHITTAFPENRTSGVFCKYDNTPLAKLPQVQCDTGGICESGKEFSLTHIRNGKFVNKTCDACVMFVCTLDGKQIIEGSGCYDDFVKACNKTNPSAVAKFKENIKTNFYYDKKMIVASCSDADNCHKYAFDNYNTKNDKLFIVDNLATQKCSYEEMIGESSSTSAPEVTTQEGNGITAIKLFFGIYLLLTLIY